MNWRVLTVERQRELTVQMRLMMIDGIREVYLPMTRPPACLRCRAALVRDGERRWRCKSDHVYRERPLIPGYLFIPENIQVQPFDYITGFLPGIVTEWEMEALRGLEQRGARLVEGEELKPGQPVEVLVADGARCDGVYLGRTRSALALVRITLLHRDFEVAVPYCEIRRVA